MELNHIGLVNRSEEEAVRMYRQALGLDLTRQFTVPAVLTEQLFSVSRDITVLVFERDRIKLEVFVIPGWSPQSPEYRHVGMMLDDLDGTVRRASEAGAGHIVGKTSEKTVHFLKDFSGNLIEIKQK